MEERRRYRRYSTSFPAQFDVIDSRDAQSIHAELRDIGQGGAYLLLNGQIDLDTPVDLIIPDYHNQFGNSLGVETGNFPFNLKILGKVVRIDSPADRIGRTGIALEFTSSVRLAPLAVNCA